MSDAAEMGAHAAAEEMGCGQSDFSVCLCSPLDPSLSGTIHLTTHLRGLASGRAADIIYIYIYYISYGVL